MDAVAIQFEQQVGGLALSTHHSQGANNNNAAGHRRERDPRAHSPNQYNGTTTTGQLPTLNTTRSYSGSFDFEELIVSLRDLFTHDRQVASQTDNKRCGICYLYATSSELRYREEGFYVCASCERALSKQMLPMIRRQQK